MSLFKSRQEALVACEAARIRFIDHCATKPRIPGATDYADECLGKLLFDLDAGVDGSISASFKIKRQHCNHENFLSGGVAVALVDHLNCWNTLMFARYMPTEGRWDTGTFASRSINASYMKPARLGITVRIVSQPVVFNKQMIYFEGYIRGLDGKQTYAAVQHHLFGVAIEGEETLLKARKEAYARSLKQAEANLRVRAKL